MFDKGGSQAFSGLVHDDVLVNNGLEDFFCLVGVPDHQNTADNRDAHKDGIDDVYSVFKAQRKHGIPFPGMPGTWGTWSGKKTGGGKNVCPGCRPRTAG